MPLVYQKMIFRADLIANPDILYVFGDNAQRRGLGGQAKEMRGEPNAHGVRTKWEPRLKPTSFFTDDAYDAICAMIEEDLLAPRARLQAGRLVVLPLDGLGTGLAQLPEKAPRAYAFLEAQLAALKTIG
jgi:hypothetical protein